MNKAATITYQKLRVGQKAGFEQTVTEKMVADFADFSGDMNPLHTDKAFAAKTEFKKPIAHGMLAGALISKLVGMQLPGKYCLFLKQELSFHKPIYPGMVLLVNGEVIQKMDAMNITKIETNIYNKPTKELLVSGQALVRLLK